MNTLRNASPLAVYGLLAILVAFALAGVLIIPTGNESTQRLGLFFGILGLAVPAVVSLIKSDQAASNTNGKLDARIQSAVHRANDARRRGEAPANLAEINAAPASDFPTV